MKFKNMLEEIYNIYGDVPIYYHGDKNILDNKVYSFKELFELMSNKGLEDAHMEYSVTTQNENIVCIDVDFRKYHFIHHFPPTLGGFLLYYNNNDSSYNQYSIVSTDNLSFPEKYRNTQYNTKSLLADLIINDEIDLQNSLIAISDIYITADQEIVKDVSIIKSDDNVIFATYILREKYIDEHKAVIKVPVYRIPSIRILNNGGTNNET